MVALGSDEKNKGILRGFAGLSSMVSDIEAIIKRVEKEATEKASDTTSNAKGGEVAQVVSHGWSTTSHTPGRPNNATSAGSATLKAAVGWLLGICALIGVFWLLDNSNDNSQFESGNISSPPVISKPSYVRPVKAPNGEPWPDKASYVSGYNIGYWGGLSTVTVDNTRNDSDVFAKLVSLDNKLDNQHALVVRTFFIPAGESFGLQKVNPGKYDIRYQDLSTGGLSRTESFALIETVTYDGIEYSNFTLTLYKVAGGDMATYELPESEF